MKTKEHIIKEFENLCSKQKKEIEQLKMDIIATDSIIESRDSEIADLKERVSKLNDQHQSDCITIIQLQTTIDILCDKYSRLRKIHGL